MSNWTQGDVDAIRQKQDKAKAPKPSKYKNVRVQIGDEKFDSKREANYWVGLKMREKAGEITDLSRQYPLDLECPSRHLGPEASSVVSHWIADFRYLDVAKDEWIYVDAKGHRTAVYSLKAKWVALQYQIVIEEV